MSAKSKPFQAATVKAATAALSGGNPLRRFLVADEVGLGKTVVARDTLAALASKARKFTVYYITSGLKVADQNKVELLRFLDKDDAKDALSIIDRVGLIPFEEKRKGKLRLYAFTPTTSFSSSQRLYGGKAVERAFIKLLLDELYPGLTAAFTASRSSVSTNSTARPQRLASVISQLRRAQYITLETTTWSPGERAWNTAVAAADPEPKSNAPAFASSSMASSPSASCVVALSGRP